VVGYHLFRDDSEIATIPAVSTSFIDTGLVTNTSYTYKVRAFDDAVPSNISAFSSSVDVTTLSPAPPPDDNDAITSPAAGAILCINAAFTVTWDTAKFSGTVEIAIGFGDQPQVWTILSVGHANNGSFTYTPATPIDKARFRIRETNNLSNFATGDGAVAFIVCGTWDSAVVWARTVWSGAKWG